MDYVPEAPANINSLEELTRYLAEELRRISAAFSSESNLLWVTPQHVEPEKPREGMIVLADGSDWNPGSGAGFYGYRGGAWVLLG